MEQQFNADDINLLDGKPESDLGTASSSHAVVPIVCLPIIRLSLATVSWAVEGTPIATGNTLEQKTEVELHGQGR